MLHKAADVNKVHYVNLWMCSGHRCTHQGVHRMCTNVDRTRGAD